MRERVWERERKLESQRESKSKEEKKNWFILKSLTCTLCELHIKFEITDLLIIDEKLAANLKYLPNRMMNSGFSVTGLSTRVLRILKLHWINTTGSEWVCNTNQYGPVFSTSGVLSVLFYILLFYICFQF